VFPRLFVELAGDCWQFGRLHKAHIRNKRGYVYLCWREGKRVRNFYLGKAPRNSPTRSADLVAPAPAAGSTPRRARK
jgi:hypothetical protein